MSILMSNHIKNDAVIIFCINYEEFPAKII